ncbi:MAG: AMP-binding protein [Acidimicrobiia bacterium]|nr:AMP-binding protein [Acidimicrobiia bacterium]
MSTATDTEAPPARPAGGLETGVPTLPQLLVRWERAAPGTVALREKTLGRWKEITYGEWARTTRMVGAGLAALGLQREDRLGILSENRPEWFHACLGAQGLGAIAFGVYPTNAAAELAYQVEDSGARVLVAEDQEQLDKAVEILDRCPSLEHVIVVERKGTVGPAYADPRIVHWDELLRRGEEALGADPQRWDRELDRAGPDDPAVIIYTSGTTGPPKGAVLTWRNIVAAIRIHACYFGVTPSDEVLSYLPLCHVAEQVMSLYDGLGCGVKVNFAESVDTVNEDLREVRPTLFFAVPRVSEKILANVEMKVADSSWFKRANYRVWRRVGEWLARRRLARRPHRLAWYEQPVYLLAWLFLFRSLQAHTGLSRVRIGLSAGAPIAPEVLFFFRAMGVPITEAYGQTECTGMATANDVDDFVLGTVGAPFPGVEVRLAEDGEILVRGDNVFAGYWCRPEATAETVDADGWLATGDVGEWVADGRLKITDRKKDIIITSGGKNLSPSEIENKLKVSPFVKEAVVIGDRRKFVSALIQIELDTVSDWAKRRGLLFTTYRDLAEKPEVHELIEGVVRAANDEMARVEQVKAFRILPRELDQDDGELTATQKVKRRIIAERYEDLIEEMYGA